MSHSYRHTRIFGNAGCKSSKWYKKWNHHRERSRVRQAILHQNYDVVDTELSPWNSWSDPRDGKNYRVNFYPQRGFGIHNPDFRLRGRSYTKEFYDKLFKKAMRK